MIKNQMIHRNELKSHRNKQKCHQNDPGRLKVYCLKQFEVKNVKIKPRPTFVLVPETVYTRIRHNGEEKTSPTLSE